MELYMFVKYTTKLKQEEDNCLYAQKKNIR